MNGRIKYIYIAVILLIVVMNISMIVMSIDARNRSLAARKQRTDIQQTINSFECVLLTQPQDRTQQTIDDCHK